MSQADPTAYVDSESGTAHVSRHNTVAAAFLSMHSGGSRPSYAAAGTLWRDSDTPSATVQTLFLYDGTDDIGLMQVDITNNYIAKFGVGIVPSGMASGTMLHVKNGASGATANTSYDDQVLEASGAAGASWMTPDANTFTHAIGSATDNDFAIWTGFYNSGSPTITIGGNRAGATLALLTGAAATAAYLAGGILFVGDTSDAGVSVGTVRNQSAADDFIDTDKSSDVAHGITDEAETDTYHGRKKQAGASGGVLIMGLSEDDSGVRIYGYVTTDNTTHTTAGGGPVMTRAAKKSGTAVGAPGDGANILVVAEAGVGTQFIVDENGKYYANSTFTEYDAHDDTGLLVELNALPALRRSGEVDAPTPEYFRSLWRMERLGLTGYVGPRQYANGIRALRCESGTLDLLVGEAAQRATREAVYVEALEQMLPGFMARCEQLAAGRNVGRLPAPIQIN